MKLLVVFLVVTVLSVLAIEHIKDQDYAVRKKAQWPPAEPAMEVVHTLNGPLYHPRENPRQ